MPTRLRKIAEQWQNRAVELTAWTTEHLLNRTDRWESYLPLRKRKKGVESITIEGQLTQKIVARHYAATRPGQLIAVCGDNGQIEPATRWLCIHICSLGKNDPVRPGQNFQAMLEWYEKLKDLGFDPILEDTDGSGSYRLLVLFDTSIPTSQSTEFGTQLVAGYADQNLLNPPRLIPLPTDADTHRTLNYIRLPGRHHTIEHYSTIWNGSMWLEADNAINALLQVQKSPAKFTRTLRLKPLALSTTKEAKNESVGPRHTEPALTLPLAIAPNLKKTTPPAPNEAAPAPGASEPGKADPTMNFPHKPHEIPAIKPLEMSEPPTQAGVNPNRDHTLTCDSELVNVVSATIATIGQRTGLRDGEIIKRVFQWLAEQDDVVQAVVLGQIPESVRPDIRDRVIKLANQ